MATKKERLDRLEFGLQEVRDGLMRSAAETRETQAQMRGMEGQLKEVLDSLSGFHLSWEKSSQNYGEKGSTSRGGHNREEGFHPHNHSQFTKMDFPKFSGDDPTKWLSRASQYFEFQETVEEQKVALASFHLEGEANQWWQWLKQVQRDEGLEITWSLFEREIMTRFGPTEYECFDEALSRVKQTGTLRDYQREFERLANRVAGWPQSALIGTFLGGLRDEIAGEVRMAKPQTLREAIGVARMKDNQLMRRQRQGRTEAVRAAPPQRLLAAPPLPAAPAAPKQVPDATDFLIGGEDEKGETSGHGPKFGPITNELEHEAGEEQAEITLHAFSGWKGPRTMKLQAFIGKQPVTVLVDSGSSHNFVSDRVACHLHLPVTSTKKFNVKIADGGQLSCQEKHEAVRLEIQGFSFAVTLFSLPLQGLDVVLGVQWLVELGPVLRDWRNLTMRFNWRGESRELHGQKDSSSTEITVQSLEKEIEGGGALFAVVVKEIKDIEGGDAQVPLGMGRLLEDFAAIFEEPRSLPPSKEVDHRIPLKEGVSAVNVRPYRKLGLFIPKKCCQLSKQFAVSTTPPVSEDGLLVLEPIAVKDSRWVKQGSRLEAEVLIQWRYLPEEEATWESVQQMENQFPNFDLEGKVEVPRAANDRSQRLRKPNPRYLDVLPAEQGRASQKDVNVGAGAIQKEGGYELDACL
ncbi:hypothetical protein F0562_010393 [Nyssa sinensis]|uniref:Retrotransposon gag domain-containing protein n=1 Tax=Nyssa sinensis TaxID=561372 RepID=A0A5J5A4G7_9ASTE|nr:hypothetical protein F0562_010393 [Nyssa sinensis]